MPRWFLYKVHSVKRATPPNPGVQRLIPSTHGRYQKEEPAQRGRAFEKAKPVPISFLSVWVLCLPLPLATTAGGWGSFPSTQMTPRHALPGLLAPNTVPFAALVLTWSSPRGDTNIFMQQCHADLAFSEAQMKHCIQCSLPSFKRILNTLCLAGIIVDAD